MSDTKESPMRVLSNSKLLTFRQCPKRPKLERTQASKGTLQFLLQQTRNPLNISVVAISIGISN